MLCERCKIREATIKYTEIINGIKTEHNLCSHCAKEMDFGQYSALLDGEFPLGKLLSGLLGLEDDEEETDVRGNVVCPTCGTSFEDFVENSRFGCADCYGGGRYPGFPDRCGQKADQGVRLQAKGGSAPGGL